MEYEEYLGTYSDIPVDIIVSGWEEAYGKDRVKRWIDNFVKSGEVSPRDFNKEDILGDDQKNSADNAVSA